MKQRTATLAVLLLLVPASLAFLSPRLAPSAGTASAAETAETVAPEPQRRTTQRRRRRPARTTAQRRPRVDYSKFNHRTRQHQQACNTCHTIPTGNWPRVRASEEAFPDVADYPDHPSCVNCHRTEFFRGARPVICTICHTNVSPRDGTRHPFQNPEEGFARALKKPRTDGTQFAINFPHDKHQDVMARLAPPRPDATGVGFVRASFARQQPQKRIDSCSICHETYQPQGDSPDVFVKPTPTPFPEPNEFKIPAFFLKKGTFMTTPTSHAACFNCHYQDGGEKPLSNDCAGCHKLLPAGKTGAFVARDHTDVDPKIAAAMGVTDKHITEKWLRRDAATFRHEWKDHAKLGCTACHVNITGISTLDQKSLKVPVATCSTSACHGSPKTTGGKNQVFLEVGKRRKPDGKDYACIKCHLNFGKDPTPQTHEALYPVGK